MAPHQLVHHPVNIRAIGLHDIVGQAVRIILVAVMDAQGRQQPTTYEVAGYQRP